MSHPHHDEEIEMVNTHNGENNVPRRHSHSHLHLRPTLVFDHIKTKVKRKRSSNTNNFNEIPAFATNHLSKQTDELDLQTPISLIQRSSDDSHENKTTDERPAIVSDHDDAGLTKFVPQRSNSIETDTENNLKTTKLKSKANKPAKSLPESTTKKPRQSTHRMGFQIRDEDFNSIFNDLPADEQLLVAYPCAWQKDILMHGRMFLSVNYLCFYTSFFKWEESLCIAYKDIMSVKREKSEKVLPNAIQLRTKNRDQYLFASYTPRERIFIAIYRLWQNALLDKPLGYQQLRTIIYADQASLEESTGDSEGSITLENKEETPVRMRSISQPQPLPAVVSKRPRESLKIQFDEGLNSSVPANSATYVSNCPCESHLARTYAERIFSYHVDQLFELTFGNNSFTRAFHDSQKLIDYTIGEWHRNNETGKRERQVTYKTVTQSILGTNTISCTETQIMEAEKPHLLYVVNTEVYNEGMKYTDAFFVATRFCMFQRNAKQSSFRVSAEVRYVKNVNAIAKSFIEKNCHSNIEDGVSNHVRRLENHQSTVKHQKSIDDQRSKKHGKRRESDENQIISNDIPSENLTKTRTEREAFVDIGFLIGISLVILHLYLCYKLYTIDRDLHSSDNNCFKQCKTDCLSKKLHH